MFDLNLKTKAVTQSTRSFNSMCKMADGTLLGVSDAGLCKICGYTDNGAQIPAMVKTGKFDLGTERVKSIRYFYLGLETTGALRLTVYCDGVEIEDYDIPYPGEGRQTIKVKVARGIKGRYGEVKLANVDGCFFALYSVKIFPVVLQSAH